MLKSFELNIKLVLIVLLELQHMVDIETMLKNFELNIRLMLMILLAVQLMVEIENMLKNFELNIMLMLIRLLDGGHRAYVNNKRIRPIDSENEERVTKQLRKQPIDGEIEIIDGVPPNLLLGLSAIATHLQIKQEKSI